MDFEARPKQEVLSINTGAILFTIKVEGYLRFVERENSGWVLELRASASGAAPSQIHLNPPLLKGDLKKVEVYLREPSHSRAVSHPPVKKALMNDMLRSSFLGMMKKGA